MTRDEISIAPMVEGATITAVLRDPRRLADDGIAAVENGDKLLLHFGRIEYTDALGNLNWIEYCLRYEPGIPLSPSGLRYMALADRCFWPKNQDAEEDQ